MIRQDSNETLVLHINMMLYAIAGDGIVVARSTPRSGVLRLGWTGRDGRTRGCEVEGEAFCAYLRDRLPYHNQLIAVLDKRARRGKKQQPTNNNHEQDY